MDPIEEWFKSQGYAIKHSYINGITVGEFVAKHGQPMERTNTPHPKSGEKTTSSNANNDKK